jgi:poly-gamma-glutamate synthesis protein (capsule biosynthesis protein)
VVVAARAGLALAVLLAFVPAACSSGPSARRADSPSTTSVASAPTSSSTTRPVTTTTVKPDRPVVLAFGGDVHFEGVLRNLLAADPATVLAPIAPVLESADIAMVNLETAITERGVPQPKQYTFRAPPSAFTALAAGGVDVTTMANNHGFDFGPVGLDDSLDAIRVTRFPVVGIGSDAAHAYAPFRRTVHGERIAIIGATQVIDDALIPTWTASDTHGGLASAKDVDRLVAEVRKARVDSDTVVVFLHWGQEGMTCPTPTQTELAHRLVDAGADIIVGSHAHRLLGAGRLGTAFVDYGLGNFAFYTQGGPGAETGVLFVTVTGRHIDGYAWRPAVINGGVPRPLTGTAGDAARARWQSRRSCTDLAP